MASPMARQEDVVTGYVYDRTQGPSCAMTCQAALVARNYFIDDGQRGQGLHDGGQLNMLDQVEQLDEVKNDKHKYWKMLNGHALFNDRIGELKLDNDETKIKVKNALRTLKYWMIRRSAWHRCFARDCLFIFRLSGT